MDIGLTHIALPVSDVEKSIIFYSKYARMHVVHRRRDSVAGEHAEVVWLSDKTRPFVIVLIQSQIRQPVLTPISHLGVGCESRAEVDRLCDEARAEGCLLQGPTDSGYPIGYWAFLSDPDGNSLELSFGQEVGLAVEKSAQ